MKPARADRWLGCVLALLLGGAARGQAVHIVAGDGSGDFAQVNDAVAAAADGDVILVRPHTERYEATNIEGKSLTIVGAGPVRPELEDVRVAFLAPDQAVTLRFLDIEGRNEPDLLFVVVRHPGVELVANAGCVWLEDLVVAGARGIPKLGGFEDGWPGLVLDDSDCVVVVDSASRGGDGGWSVAGSSCPGGEAGRALRSRAALHGAALVGGEGGQGVAGVPAQGGIGLDGAASILFASGSTLAGGDTGDDTGPVPPQLPTAPALLVRGGSDVQHLATAFASGGGRAAPGRAIAASGPPSTVADLDDDHRALDVTAVVRKDEPVQVTYAGRPGDRVLLRLSARPGWTFVPSHKGVQHLGATTVELFLGAADATGTLRATIAAPRLPPGVEAATHYVQPLVTEADGARRLGAPSVLVVIQIPRPPRG